MNWWETGAFLSLMLALLALLLLALAPLGWRAGWWHFRFAFTWLMTASGVAALAAGIVALGGLLLGWSQLSPRRLTIATIGLVLVAVLVYVPWRYGPAHSRHHNRCREPTGIYCSSAGAECRRRGHRGLRRARARTPAEGGLSGCGAA